MVSALTTLASAADTAASARATAFWSGTRLLGGAFGFRALRAWASSSAFCAEISDCLALSSASSAANTRPKAACLAGLFRGAYRVSSSIGRRVTSACRATVGSPRVVAVVEVARAAGAVPETAAGAVGAVPGTGAVGAVGALGAVPGAGAGVGLYPTISPSWRNRISAASITPCTPGALCRPGGVAGLVGVPLSEPRSGANRVPRVSVSHELSTLSEALAGGGGAAPASGPRAGGAAASAGSAEPGPPVVRDTPLMTGSRLALRRSFVPPGLFASEMTSTLRA